MEAEVKEKTLLLLRVSIGILMVLWGIDKLVNLEHGLAVSDRFYLGLFSVPILIQIFGVLQIGLGLFVMIGLARTVLYPALLVITGATVLGVWRSIVDPWGWVLEGSNVLFYPSLITFAGALVLWAFRDEDRIAVDTRRGS
jgi:putative oxidoreductase